MGDQTYKTYQTIINCVNKLQQDGYNEGQIKQALLQEGFSTDDIVSALLIRLSRMQSELVGYTDAINSVVEAHNSGEMYIPTLVWKKMACSTLKGILDHE